MSFRVLQVIDTLGMGGAETWLMEVLRLWSSAGTMQMDFLATSGKAGIFDEEARGLGARIYYLPYSRRALPRFASEFRHLLKSRQYQAIHDHQDYASGWHFLLGSGGLPLVRVTHVHNPAYQIRNNYGISRGRRIIAAIGKRLVARYATHITGTSRQVVSEYGFDAPGFRHIPKAALHCGFAPSRFSGDRTAAHAELCGELKWLKDARIILFAGRIDQSPDRDHPQTHKNSAFAVSVAIEAARRDSRVHAIFAGALSPALPVLEERIASAGLSDRIRFLGVRRDIERLMLASDVLLFPSRGEGLGMVTVEAQAAGLHVLASNAVPRECVVVPELVHFLPLSASEAEWASALLRYSAMDHLGAAEANQRVARSSFAIANSAAALHRLYSRGELG